jgi:hypothetical protein
MFMTQKFVTINGHLSAVLILEPIGETVQLMSHAAYCGALASRHSLDWQPFNFVILAAKSIGSSRPKMLGSKRGIFVHHSEQARY